MRIRVTQKHIQDGEAGETGRCPIALALSEAGMFCPSVGSFGIYLNSEGKIGDDRERHVFLPREAQDFVENFDDGSGVDPFEFNISAECFMP